MTNTFVFTHLSDHELLAQVRALVQQEREATSRLIASLAELDERRLYLGQGCSSLFTYCTRILHLSEHAAYGRIQVARAARRFPILLDLLADGAVNLTTVGLLAPHLTPENHRDVLERARHKSKRDVEQMVAALYSRPEVPSTVRRLPAPQVSAAAAKHPPQGEFARRSDPDPPVYSADPPHPPARPALVAPLTPERYKVQLTVSRETYEKLRRAQDLLRHTIPTGDPAAIFDRALTVLLGDLERARLGAARHPHRVRVSDRRSRHVPAAVKREVWTRDGGQCAFVGQRADALSEASWSSITSCRLPMAVRRWRRICSSAAARTMRTREEWFGPLVAREVAAAYNSVRTELLSARCGAA